jgi:HEXXH motif-containing protein
VTDATHPAAARGHLLGDHPPGEHRLATAHFLQLADGGGDSAALATLRAGQRSRRLLMVRALVMSLRERPDLLAPLPAAEAAWSLLLAAERADPAALDTVLMHPHAGGWLGAVTRALWPARRREEPPAQIGWEAAGYLHALAAAAAVRAGLPFRLPVPLIDGGVLLPATGRAPSPAERTAGGPGRYAAAPAVSPLAATAPGIDGRATAEVFRDVPGGPAWVTWPGTQVRVDHPDADGPGWWALRRLSSAPGAAVPAAMVVDDLDPWRNFQRPSRAERLGPAELARWQELFAAAWDLLDRQDAVDPSGLSAALLSLAPLPDRGPAGTFSGTAPDSFGGVLASLPDSPSELAATLVHEAQHIKLSALDDLVPLLRKGGLEERHYSPWRADPRPVRGILQGTYAFLGVCRFWGALAAGEGGKRQATADFEFALRRTQSWTGLRTVRDWAPLTEAGMEFAARMEAAVAALLREPVPAAAERAAREAVADHRMLYRLAHLQPPATRVEQYAAALLAGEPPPAGPLGGRLNPGPVLPPLRGALLRLRFSAPERLSGGGEPPPAGTADLLWARGERAAARAAYLARIQGAGTGAPGYGSEDTAGRGVVRADAYAWAGLGLTTDDPRARRTLLARPEWAAALHRAVLLALPPGAGPPPSPEAVASWLAPAVPTDD